MSIPLDPSVVVAELLVGLTGALGVSVLDTGPLVSEPIQDAPLAHSRPLWQQPPPRLAGHENHPVVHVYADVSEGDAAEEEGVVGTTTTAVDVELGDGDGAAEVDGWTNVTEVPATTPGSSCQHPTISCECSLTSNVLTTVSW